MRANSLQMEYVLNEFVHQFVQMDANLYFWHQVLCFYTKTICFQAFIQDEILCKNLPVYFNQYVMEICIK